MDEVAFGRYRLMAVIGSGGMGTVYRAHDTKMRRDVAIKVLSAEVAAEPGYRERFQREAYTAARLTEPHIIPIHEADEIDGRLYLTMPVIEGIDVANVLRCGGPMPAQRAVGVIEQLAAALDAAHRAGLVHRDVKPSNALLTGNEFVYLIDFGVAHDVAATRLTRTGSIVGTWAYMAPERFGTHPADARADVYALACVLHECVTGQLPFPGDSLQQQIAGHLTGEPPRPSLLNTAVPAGFDEVIARGMAKDPQARFQTAPQLAIAARQALTTPVSWWPAAPGHAPIGGALPVQSPTLLAAPVAAAPTLMGPPITGLRGRRRSRTRWLIGAGAAVAALVTIAVVVAVIGLPPGPTPAATPQTTTPQTTATAPMVASDGLDSILLSVQDVNTVMGASGMQPNAPIDHGGRTTPVPLSNPDCLATFYPAQAAVYQGSGYTAISAEDLQEPGNGADHVVEQAAVSFSSADRALAFLKTSAAKWRACAGQTITVTLDGQISSWTFGNLVGDVPAITQLHTAEGGSSVACQHALRVVLNVVLDVTACGYQISDQAGQITEKMAATATQRAH